MRLRSVLFLMGLIYLMASGCRKSPLEEPADSGTTKDVLIYEKNKENGKSLLSGQLETERYELDLGNVSGQLTLSLDPSGMLVSSSVSQQLYNYLIQEYGGVEVGRLPGSIIEQANEISKEGYRYFQSGKYIITMSQDTFDKEMEKCESRPTTAGVLLCASRIIIRAIKECLQAPPDQKHIHCW